MTSLPDWLSRPLFPPQPGLSDLGRGAALPLRAVALLRASPALRRLARLCAAVTFLSLLAVGWAAFFLAPRLVGQFYPPPDGFLAHLLWQLSVVLAFGLLLFIGLATFPLLMLAPFQDALSEATERLWGAPPSKLSAVRASALAVGRSAARVALLWAGHGALLFLNLLPGLGTTLWAGASVLWSSYWNAGEYLDLPMARHGHSFAAVRRLLYQRRAACLGFGAAIYLLMWVPLLNLFFIPVAVVGGTLLFRGLDSTSSVVGPQED